MRHGARFALALAGRQTNPLAVRAQGRRGGDAMAPRQQGPADAGAICPAAAAQRGRRGAGAGSHRQAVGVAVRGCKRMRRGTRLQLRSPTGWAAVTHSGRPCARQARRRGNCEKRTRAAWRAVGLQRRTGTRAMPRGGGDRQAGPAPPRAGALTHAGGAPAPAARADREAHRPRLFGLGVGLLAPRSYGAATRPPRGAPNRPPVPRHQARQRGPLLHIKRPVVRRLLKPVASVV